ncbi:hypothetical protein C8Q75DRAFT_361635 [Abortiporus biennis]|nr:hypothetical protein C8Q75DRAFT_361635 [Abortiporus biennis]
MTNHGSPSHDSTPGGSALSTSRHALPPQRKRSDPLSDAKVVPARHQSLGVLSSKTSEKADTQKTRSAVSKDAHASRLVQASAMLGQHSTAQRGSPVASQATLPSTSYMSSSAPTKLSLLSASNVGVLDSVSDYGNSSRSIRQPSRAPSPHTGYTSSHLNAAHLNPKLHSTSRTGVSSHTSSGSDREGHGHLDLKRLLSKPAAVPSHSGASVISIPSDQEFSGISSSGASSIGLGTRRRAEMLAHETRTRNFSAPSQPPSIKIQTSHGSVSSSVRLKNSSSGRISPSASRYESERERESRSKNVIKRKSSSRSNPSTPTVATFKAAASSSTSLQPIAPSPSHRDSSSSHSTSRPSKHSSPSPAGSSKTATDTISPRTPRKVASAGTSLAESSSRSKLRETLPQPKGLTPAGAVAHAYKQQEQRREKLAEMAGWNDHQRKMAAASVGGSAADNGNLSSISLNDSLGDQGGESTAGPYYTVFGSRTSRLFDHDDHSWQLNFDSYYGCDDRTRVGKATVSTGNGGNTSSGGGSGSGSGHGVKHLSRKVSGRFKKVAGAVKGHREMSPQHGRPEVVLEAGSNEPGWTPYDGRRRSGHHEKSPSVPSKPKSDTVRDSTDDYVKVSVGELERDGILKATEEKERPSKLVKERSRSRGEEDGSSSGKLWKLMKRISTGGLRDKYKDIVPPPPVPSLPKDLQHMPASRATLDIKATDRDNQVVGETGVLLTRFMQSRSSMSGVRPFTAPQRVIQTQRTEVLSRPSTGRGTESSGNRPSTTTRSSSPMSSDIASARFFQRTHSARSSTSSYGEELPPMPSSPTAVIAQHIMPPSELYKLNKDIDPASPQTQSPLQHKRSRKPSRSRSAPAEDTDDHRPSLPLPPRRAATAGGGKESKTDPPSPTIPSFNTSDTLNNFKTKSAISLTMSEFGGHGSPISPTPDIPPRPRRSSRRHPPPDLISPGTASVTSPTVPPTPRTPTLTLDLNGSARKPFTSPSFVQSPSPISAASSSSKSPLTFREIESPRHVWSEKEKADKWNDLLLRSDRAGGTLHIGDSSGLMSDSLRFSTYSDSPDQEA